MTFLVSLVHIDVADVECFQGFLGAVPGRISCMPGSISEKLGVPFVPGSMSWLPESVPWVTGKLYLVQRSVRERFLGT